MEHKRIGLVLSGGGGKGAYQIGVWKAMREYGITANAVAGTSVGALNGALIATDAFEEAVQTWTTIESKNVLSLNEEHFSETLLKKLENLHIDLTKLPESVRTKGLFSQEGLIRMMDESLNTEKLHQSAIPFYVCSHHVERNEVRYFHVNPYRQDDIKKILLSSSALPGIFDDVEIENEIYSDGGFYWLLPHKKLDNTPIQPIYQEACDLIIVVALSRDELIPREAFPNAKILPILPRESMGNALTGTMDFSNDGAKRRMEEGYRDGKQIFSQLNMILNNEQAYEQLWKEIQDNEKEIKETFSNIKEQETERTEIRHTIDQFNQLILEDDFSKDVEWVFLKKDSLLDWENQRLLTQLDRQNIEIEVDRLVAQNADNSDFLQAAAVDMVSFVAPIQGRAREISEQGFVARLWNGITGKNIKMISHNQQELAKAHFAMQTLFSALQEKGLFTLELAASINNKANWLFAEVGQLHQDLNDQYKDIYRTIIQTYVKFRRELMDQREKIAVLENRVSKLEWLSHIEVQTFKGKEYRHLSKTAKLICVVNDFYRMTAGNWNVRELDTLKVALLRLGIEQTTISLEEFFQELLIEPFLKERFTERLSLSSPSKKPPLLLESVMELNDRSIEIDMDYSLTVHQPTYHFALELLLNLRQGGYEALKQTTLSKVKKDYVDYIDFLQKLIKKYELSDLNLQELEQLKEKITNFKITIPLLGVFSSGKTALINSYLGTELFKEDLNPETAIATELHANEEEKIVAHFISGKKATYPLSELKNIVQKAEQLAYIEVHLNHTALFQYSDLVLVDMPGIDSNIRNHNKAIRQYISSGVSFILCVPVDLGVKESVKSFIKEMSLYNSDFSLIFTKEELRYKGDIPKIIEENTEKITKLTGNDLFVGSVSAHEQRIRDFKQALLNIDHKKDQLLHQQYSPILSSITEKLKKMLSILTHTEDLSVSELEKRKRQLETNNIELKRMLDKEKRTIYQQFESEVLNGVVNDVKIVLHENYSLLKDALKVEGNIQGRLDGLINNAFKVSVLNRGQQQLQAVSQRLGRYVSTQVYAVYDRSQGVTGIEKDTNAIGETANQFSGIGTVGAGLLLGPITFPILKGLFSYFQKKEQEKELLRKMNEIVRNGAEAVRNPAREQLIKMADHFFEALMDQIERVMKETSENINLLENQLQKNKDEVAQKQKELQGDLKEIERKLTGKGKGTAYEYVE